MVTLLFKSQNHTGNIGSLASCSVPLLIARGCSFVAGGPDTYTVKAYILFQLDVYLIKALLYMLCNIYLTRLYIYQPTMERTK